MKIGALHHCIVSVVALTQTPFKLKPELSGLKTGIYCIENMTDGKLYIGCTERTFSRRWSIHRLDLRKGVHFNKHLQAAWNKYGESNFRFRIIAPCTPEWCVCLEQIYIARFKSTNPALGYNRSANAGPFIKMRDRADKRPGFNPCPKGIPLPDELREKIKAAQSTPGSRARMSTAQKIRFMDPVEKSTCVNRINSLEAIAKRLKKMRSPESRKGASDQQRERWASYSPEKKESIMNKIRAGQSRTLARRNPE